MNTPDSFFLPKHKNNITTEEELLTFLQNLFPSYIPVQTQGSIFKSLTTLLLHATGPISHSALELYLGPFFTLNNSRTKFYRHVKNGSFLSYPLKSMDLNSNVTYGISQESNRLIRSYTPDLQSDAYIRKRGSTPTHAYGIGLSTLSLMQLNIPFEFHDHIKSIDELSKCSVITDRKLHFFDQNPWELLLEQDMGTERTDILIQKIRNYGCATKTSPSSHLLFASHAIIPYPAVIRDANLNHFEYILSFMSQKGLNTLSQVYTQYDETLPCEISLTVRQLLVKHGIYKAHSAQPPFSLLPWNKVDNDSILFISSNIITLDYNYLKYYIDIYQRSMITPYFKRQYQISKKKFQSICKKLSSLFLLECHYDEFNYIENGCSIYVVPSVMLNNYYEYFNPKTSGLYQKIINSMHRYLGTPQSIPYSNVSSRYYLLNHASIIFRNCFTLSEDCIICVEHIGIDIAGFMRALAFVKSQANLPVTIYLYCLCDTMEDALFFLKQLDGTPTNNLDKIFFLYTFDLDNPARMQKAIKDGDEWTLSKPIPFQYS